jgi:hypothetical protein
VTFPELRHSAVGLMIALNAHPRVVQRWVGHASIRTTFDLYGSVLPEVDEGITTGPTQMLADRPVYKPCTDGPADTGTLAQS